MFLRPNHRDKDGKQHTYWSLVESVRTPDGPRQRTLCHLGELNGADHARWLKVVDDDAADVPWSRVAALLAINRLCAPGSELAIEQRWFPSTALDDLLGMEESKINDTRLYRCLDRICRTRPSWSGISRSATENC